MRVNKKRFGKHGTVGYAMILAITKIIFTIFVALVLVAIVFSTLTVEITAGTPHVITTMQKIVSSKDLIYQNKETGVYYPEIIDWQKFKLSNINKILLFNRENKFLSINMTLIKRNPSGHTDEKNILFNDKHYKEMYARTSLRGAGATSLFKVKQPVLIYDNGRIKEGLIKAYVIIPREG